MKATGYVILGYHRNEFGIINPVTYVLNSPLHTKEYIHVPHTFYVIKWFHVICESASKAGDFEVMFFILFINVQLGANSE
jgi:hypothetical protein